MHVTQASIVVAGPMSPIVTSASLDVHPMAAADQTPVAAPLSSPPTSEQPLHRLGEVRRREGLTRQQLARRLGISAREVQRQEQSSSDMLLSDLHHWQQALGVPISELLHEPVGELSPPVRLRARLLRVMKTVRSIQQRARPAPLRRLVETLVIQLVEVMPELTETAPWPSVGHRRRSRELGQAFFRRLAIDPLDELEGPEQ